MNMDVSYKSPLVFCPICKKQVCFQKIDLVKVPKTLKTWEGVDEQNHIIRFRGKMNDRSEWEVYEIIDVKNEG